MVTATPIEERTAIVLRPRPATNDPRCTYCSDCWEPIAHEDGSGWRHVRTGKSAVWNHHDCAPLCDWPGCDHDADATRSLGGDEWTGSGFRYRARHFLCAAHWITAERIGLGWIERT